MANAWRIVRHMEIKYHGLNDLQAYRKYLQILKEDTPGDLHVIAKKKRAGDRECYDLAFNFYYGLPETDWMKGEEPEVIRCRDYMVRRGFQPATLSYVGAKITYDQNYMMIFPMLENGKFRGWVRRTDVLEIEKKRKYLYNTGFSRAQTLAGEYGKKKYVFVVEGFMDRLKFVQFGIDNCVAILGWKATREQIWKLKQAGITMIVSALDNDEYGQKGTRYLEKFFRVIRLAYEKRIKDPGEMDREIFDRILKKTMNEVEFWEY